MKENKTRIFQGTGIKGIFFTRKRSDDRWLKLPSKKNLMFELKKMETFFAGPHIFLMLIESQER